MNSFNSFVFTAQVPFRIPAALPRLFEAAGLFQHLQQDLFCLLQLIFNGILGIIIQSLVEFTDDIRLNPDTVNISSVESIVTAYSDFDGGTVLHVHSEMIANIPLESQDIKAKMIGSKTCLNTRT